MGVAVIFKKFLRTVLILAVLSTPAYVMAAAEGDYTSEVLAIGVGARALGMGGAFVGAATDATAAYWNPAGLSFVDKVEITTIHATQSSIQTYDFFNVAFNTNKAGTYAASYIRLSVDEIPVTSAAGPTVLTTTSDIEQVLLLSGGWRFAKRYAVGTTIKLLKNDVYTASAFGYGSDIGFLVKPVRQLGVGLSIRDFTGGSYVKWKGTPTSPTQKIAPSVKFGLSYIQELGKRVNSVGATVPTSTLTVNADVDTLYVSKQLNKYHFGAEYWYRQFVALRGGFESHGLKFNKDAFAPSFGLGVWVYLMEVDYAYVNFEISPTHYLSVITRF